LSGDNNQRVKNQERKREQGQPFLHEIKVITICARLCR
jgi:hypothetical protein